MGKKKQDTKEKPLEKMTSKELRVVALTLPEITGVHGMNKVELISGVKKARGIVEAPSNDKATGREIKQKMRQVKVALTKAVEASDEKMAAIYKKRVVRLKKRTRRLAT
ncbi:MAG: transcription termination factor Rho [Desulfobacteraceae bacterium]|nr:transcription termination factor Rho [Desulfobacteraceae bacterium]MBU4002171.1 transcription termination factor Rho [Pseudomonadota bacterium]MBU4054517.1 transcription termination factor Rho [Pseudomonadota bacterium]